MSDSWSTADEIKFIIKMVTEYHEHGEFTKERLLKNYIKCALHRKDNGLTSSVKWSECIKTAETMLNSLPLN